MWGGSGKGAHEVGAWAKGFGRTFEEVARDVILPEEGFTEIDDTSALSNVFFIDFIATLGTERVLVDVTSKWKAHIPAKHRLARSLRMRLFILHVSPADPTVYHLHEPAGVSAKVPLTVFHRLHAKRDQPIPGWPKQIGKQA